MNLDPSEEQRLLAASIERFVERDYAFETRRRIVASRRWLQTLHIFMAN